jgi:glycerate-2-kinase
MPAPVAGVGLVDKQRVTQQLLRCGADIAEMNTVRKHLSDLKGGRLAASTSATVVTVVLSDVIGDDLSAVASGPTFPDPTTYADAIDCLRRHHLWSSAPPAVRAHLMSGVQGRLTETPKPGDRLFHRVHHQIIGNNEMALAALASKARSMGLRTVLLPPLVKESRLAAASLCRAAYKVLTSQRRPRTKPCCLVAGGETTVTVSGRGKGGRAQEFAVAAAKAIAGLRRVYVAAIGTDGTDGPTDVAGALVDGDTWSRAKETGVDLDAALIDHDTYRALKRLRSHIITGPTGTNVNDLYLLLVF